MEKDARSLPAAAQESLRLRAIRAVMKGTKQGEVAELLGVTRQAVARWVQAHRRGGVKALKTRRRGRPPGGRMQAWQAAHVLKALTSGLPDQSGLEEPLWTREQVARLIRQQFGMRLSRWTVQRYLKNWGLAIPNLRRRFATGRTAAERRWRIDEYPRLRRQARRERAQIHWFGMTAIHPRQTRAAPVGRTPDGELVGAITNRGHWKFMVAREGVTPEVLLDFLGRLVRQSTCRIFLIAPRHPLYQAPCVVQWLAENAARLHLVLLPDEGSDEALRQPARKLQKL